MSRQEDKKTGGAPSVRNRRALLPKTPLAVREEQERPRVRGSAARPVLPRLHEQDAPEAEQTARPRTVSESAPKSKTAPSAPPRASAPARQEAVRTSRPVPKMSREAEKAEQTETSIPRRSAVRPRRRKVIDQPSPPKSTLRASIARVGFALLILAAAAGFYKIWERQTKQEALPPMFMPQPYYYEEEQPVHAILLWREKVVKSPVAGTVQLAAGQKPWTAATNDVLATVLARGKGTPVRAASRGYFLPALDGAEDSWDYSTLWLGSGLLPKPPQLNWIRDLSALDSSRAVGKLIALPQDPRAIFYLNLTDTLKSALERGRLTIRRESRGPKWSAHVRVYVKYSEERAKVCLDLPYFPLDMVQSRELDFLVCSDEDSGLLVPDSAVTIRNGTYGVFELVGDQLIFRSITGKPVRDGMFFVSSGLSPGNPVIVNAANAEEKRVRLW